MRNLQSNVIRYRGTTAPAVSHAVTTAVALVRDTSMASMAPLLLVLVFFFWYARIERGSDADCCFSISSVQEDERAVTQTTPIRRLDNNGSHAVSSEAVQGRG